MPVLITDNDALNVTLRRGLICVCMYLCNEDVICNFRRDKTFNFFSVMLKKRLKNEEDDSLDAEEGETSATKSKGRLRKDLVSSL